MFVAGCSPYELNDPTSAKVTIIEEGKAPDKKPIVAIANHPSSLAAGGEPQKEPEPVEFEYDPETKSGYISVKGKGPEARAWMLKQIEEICASKNIVIQEGAKPSEPARFRVLNETFRDGKFTIKFELVR